MQFVRINDIVIHYKFIQSSPLGDRDKTFVFINSLGTDFRIWEEVVKRMEGYGNFLLFDKRGHGLSDVAVNTKSLEEYMQDVVELLMHLKINKCTLIGLSVGGMIAQLLAYHHREKIERLVLCDTRHKIGNPGTWNERIKAVREEDLSSISEGVMERWFSKRFRTEQQDKVNGYRNMLERTPVAGYIQTCEAIRDTDLMQMAKEIKISTLCIAGSEDKSTTPEEVKQLSDLIEGSKYEIIQGSGHIPCVDNPEALSKLIIDFIKS